MTQEDKNLLLRDLSGRLPYGVKANATYFDWQHDEKLKRCDTDITYGNIYEVVNNWNDCKPYLRPMSSMTEEEKREYTSYVFEQPFLQKDKVANLGSVPMCVDWLNAHHFDYRGLIEKGLALEAPEGMYKTE